MLRSYPMCVPNVFIVDLQSGSYSFLLFKWNTNTFQSQLIIHELFLPTYILDQWLSGISLGLVLSAIHFYDQDEIDFAPTDNTNDV